jgi:hypothetical protein
VLVGIALLVINGIVSTVALVGATRGRSGAALAHVADGEAPVGWILTQLLVIGLLAPAFQLGYLTLGLVILGLGLAALQTAHWTGTTWRIDLLQRVRGRSAGS